MSTWYVDKNASGSNNGTSWTNAWTSFSAITQSALIGGDFVWVKPGTYDERVTFSKSGTTGSRINYVGYGTKPKVLGFNGTNMNYISVVNFECTNPSSSYFYPGIYLLSSSGWLIENNYAHNTSVEGIDLHNTEGTGKNIIRCNRVAETGISEKRTGYAAIIMHGSGNLAEYNEVGICSDYVRIHSQGNVYRNNKHTYTSELELPDFFPSVFTASGGDWNSSSGVWHKAGVDLSGVLIYYVVQIYADGGDPYSFMCSVSSSDNTGKNVNIAMDLPFTGNSKGVLPPSASGSYTIRVSPGGHIDHFQTFESGPSGSSDNVSQVLYENNWLDSNQSDNSHNVIIQDDVGSSSLNWLIDRNNVVRNNGSATHLFWNFDKAKVYNNTYYQLMVGSYGAFNSPVGFDSRGVCRSHSYFNNTWTDTRQALSQPLFGDTTASATSLYCDYNHLIGGNYINHGTHNVTGVSGSFVNTSSADYHLSFYSPLRNAGRPIAYATNSGSSSTTLTVDDTYVLFDGWGVTSGDSIIIGGAPEVLISSINNVTGIVTLSSPRTWSSGSAINFPHTIGNDIGAYKYRNEDMQILSSIVTQFSSSYVASIKVKNSASLRGIEIVQDGWTIATASLEGPSGFFNATWPNDGASHSLEARMLSRFASSTHLITASLAIGSYGPRYAGRVNPTALF